jgi:ATP synthase F1 delta subunit
MAMHDDMLAKYYAVAFLNLFKATYTSKDMERLFLIEQLLRKHRYLFVSLQRPNIPRHLKEQVINEIIEHFDAQKNITQLTNALLKRNRIELLPAILKHMRHEYDKLNHIISLRITSSHPLSQEQKEVARKIAASMTSAHTICTFDVDEQLIVGLRIEGKEHLWERSIRKELTDFSTIIAQKGSA